MVTQNDYNLNLFNGDVGIVMKDDQDVLKVYFPTPDGSFRLISPFMLPQWELVYAMTVHKSQGSEFTEVLMILPDQPSPVVTRELIYTGITRAKEKVIIWGTDSQENDPPSLFESFVSKKVERHSGLKDLLGR